MSSASEAGRSAGWNGRSAWCGGQEDHPALLACRLLDQLAGKLDAAVPALGRGPAIVDGEHEGATAAQARGRVQDRAGKRQDQQGRQSQAEQQQPEGGPGRGALAALQAEQEEKGREGDLARGRRSDAEEEPEGREGDEAQEQPGLGETEKAQIQHAQCRARGASIATRERSAVSAGRSVRWVAKRHCCRPHKAPKVSRCARNTST